MGSSVSSGADWRTRNRPVSKGPPEEQGDYLGRAPRSGARIAYNSPSWRVLCGFLLLTIGGMVCFGVSFKAISARICEQQ